ncbi:MAG: hypothetical protein AB7S54_07990 [Bacteroidales bacterium]
MKQINELLGILILVFFLSCEEKIEKEDPLSPSSIDTVFISDNLQKQFYEIGSIWVFESESGLRDTIKLLNIERNYNRPVYTHGNLEMGYVETYKFSYNSSRIGNYWDQYIGYVIVRNGINWGNEGEYIYLSSYKLKDSSAFASIDSILETMSVSEIEYKNVVKMKIMDFSFENNENWYYYFVDSIGIIKKEKISVGTNEKCWSLIYRN